MQDFNNRQFPLSASNSSDSMMPSLDELTKDCDFYLTMTFRDSGRDFFLTGKAWQDAFYFGSNTTQKPMAVVGPWSSHISAKLATLAAVTSSTDGEEDDEDDANSGFISISPASATNYLEDRMRYPWFSRTQVAPGNFGSQFVTYLLSQQWGVRQYAILYPATGFGRAVQQGMLQEAALLSNNDMKVFSASYVDGNIESMKQAVELLASKDFVYFYCVGPSKELILQLYDAGLMGFGSNRMWTFVGSVIDGFLTTEGANNDNRMGDVHKALNGSAFIALQFNKESEQPIIARHLKEWNRRKQALRNDPIATRYLQSRMRGGLLECGTKEEFNATGTDRSNNTTNTSLVNMMNCDANGTHLFYSLLNSSSFKASYVDLNTYDAVMALGVAACQTPDFTTKSLYETLKHVEFYGASYHVAFNTTTCSRRADSLGGALHNLLIDSSHTNQSVLTKKLVSVHWKNEHGQFVLGSQKANLVFSDGATTPLESLGNVDENMNLVPIEVRALCWCMAALVVLLSIISAVWTILHRQQAAVQTSQPSYLVLLCLGTFLLGSSILPFTWQEPMPKHVLDAGCMLNVWLLSIGFSMAFSALFCKTWRIRRVVHSARTFRRLKLVASDVVWIPSLVFGLNLALLIGWTTIGPLYWDRVTLKMDAFGRVTESRGTCFTFDGVNAGIVFGSFLVLVNLFAFFLAGIQSFKARNLPSVFNESFYMTVTICVIVEAFLIGLPIMVVVQSNTIAFMVVGSWITTVAALSVLIPLFWPKITGSGDSGGEAITNNLALTSTRQLWQDTATQITGESCRNNHHARSIRAFHPFEERKLPA